MTGQMMLKSPLLASSKELTMRSSRRTRAMSKSTERRRLGEVAGEAAADCAAVSCCCPCAAVNLMVLAVYKVPAAVCRKAWIKSKRRHFMNKRHGLLASTIAAEGSTIHARLYEKDLTAEIVFQENDMNGDSNDIVRLDDEMLERFYGAGFWRSPSQRDASPRYL